MYLAAGGTIWIAQLDGLALDAAEETPAKRHNAGLQRLTLSRFQLELDSFISVYHIPFPALTLAVIVFSDLL